MIDQPGHNSTSGLFRPTRRSFLAAGAAVAALLGIQALPACSRTGPKQGNSRVVVIGAGIAGIAAAARLASMGFDVTVLEARNRLGGRIFTDRSLGVPVDFGAQWIEGTAGNPIALIAESIGATTRSTDEDKTALYDPGGRRISGARLDAVGEMPERLAAELERLESASNEATSLLDAIRMTPTGARTSPDLDWILETLTIGVAEELDRVSAAFTDEGDEFDGDSVILPTGYDKVVENSATGLDIRLGEPVLKVASTESQAVVQTSKSEYVADRVVVTVPLGVLKSGSPEFTAPLGGDKEKAIAGLGFGTVTKVAMLFSERFWPRDVDFLGFEATPSAPFEVMLRLDEDKPLLLAYAAGDAARRLTSLTDREIADLAISRVATALPVAPLERAVVWRWDVDPWARGAYSNIPVGQTPKLRGVLAAPVASRLFFAGEATSIEYPGTVHGAYLSGIREAERIADL